MIVYNDTSATIANSNLFTTTNGTFTYVAGGGAAQVLRIPTVRGVYLISVTWYDGANSNGSSILVRVYDTTGNGVGQTFTSIDYNVTLSISTTWLVLTMAGSGTVTFDYTIVKLG
jgi:hypothetical protein